MTGLVALCRTATPFAKDKSIDEEAHRRYLQRFIDAKVGVYVASGGSGEGHALTHEDLRRVYRITVEACKGKVQTNANPPEQNTARATIEQTLLAAEAGIEIVNVYQAAAWHGYRAQEEEMVAYYDTVLGAVKHPVALSPNPVFGYHPSAALLADVVRKYPQVVAINLASLGPGYFIELKNRLTRDVPIHVIMAGTPNTLSLGAAGIIGGEINIVPKTFRRYVDAFESGNLKEMGAIFEQLQRFTQHMKNSAWYPSNARSIKMAMKVLKLPGGEGGLREPYYMPGEEKIRKFSEGLLNLGLPEINEQAKAAGVAG